LQKTTTSNTEKSNDSVQYLYPVAHAVSLLPVGFGMGVTYQMLKIRSEQRLMNRLQAIYA
jgi:hypothetical protein